MCCFSSTSVARVHSRGWCFGRQSTHHPPHTHTRSSHRSQSVCTAAFFSMMVMLVVVAVLCIPNCMLIRAIPTRLVHASYIGIIKIVEVFRMMNTIYIVMELCSGGELFDYAMDQPGSKFTEQRAQRLAKKMLASLRYIHSQKIAHRCVVLLHPLRFLITRC